MWAHTLSNPYLNVNADPCGHVTGSILNRNGRSRSLSTAKSCSTFNTRPSLNMALIGRGCISYSETWSLGSPYAGSAKIRLIHMGLLDHLWDDTVAGPRPDNGLSKLRKHHTFNFRPSSGKGTTLWHISQGPRVLNYNRQINSYHRYYSYNYHRYNLTIESEMDRGVSGCMLSDLQPKHAFRARSSKSYKSIPHDLYNKQDTRRDKINLNLIPFDWRLFYMKRW